MNKQLALKGQMSDSFLTAIFVVLSGGFQDAYTYICRGGVFANAQTGNIVLLSTSLFKNDRQNILKYLIPIIAFLIGTALAELVHMRLKNFEKIHWRQIILLCEIFLLFSVGFLPSSKDHLANALVSFVCALQVQTFHKIRGHIYASTMCIGNMRSGTESLCAYFRTKDKGALHKALTYFSVIIIFGIGAGVGSALADFWGIEAIWVCCVLLLVSFSLMFVKEKQKHCA